MDYESKNKESVFGGCRIKSGMTSSGESGRSMVEMLGVLAIIGVLSIGGIAGYRYAMTKYHANEILNEVRKRAVVASQQRILGQADINLSEFGNAFPIETADTENGLTFALKATQLSEAVCAEVKKQTLPIALNDTEGECGEGENNELTFTFANDLGSSIPEAVDEACADVTCPIEGTACYRGECLCPSGHEVCGGVCCESGMACNQSGDYSTAECVAVTGCTSYKDCNAGEYCNLIESSGSGYSTNPDAGTCEPIGSHEEIKIGSKTLWAGPDLTWWAANDWCRAQGKRLVSVSTFNCASGWDSCEYRYEHEYKMFCNKNPLTCDYETDRDAERSDEIKAFMAAGYDYDGYYHYTSTKDNNSYNNRPYLIVPGYGIIYGDYISYGYSNAMKTLCE